MSTVLYFLLAISLLVVIHEFGHFWVARRCGIKVIRFSVGFGTPLFSFKDKHGTEFSVAPIPLGGYVKMLDEREGPVPEHEKHMAFTQKTPWQRIAVASAGPIANFIFAIIAYWAIFVVGTQGLKPVIGEVEVNSLAAQHGLMVGDEILTVDGEETESMTKVMWQLIGYLGTTDKIEMTVQNIDSGMARQIQIPVESWLSEEEAPDPFEALGLKTRQLEFDVYVGQLIEDGRGARAGLKSGDRLVAVDGVEIQGWRQWVAYIQARPETPIVFTIHRDGNPLEITVTPAKKEQKDGSFTGYVGIGPDVSKIPPVPKDWIAETQLSPLAAIPRAFIRTWDTIEFTIVSLWKMIKGELSVKNLSGPIQIAKVADNSASAGIFAFVTFLALLSVSLGVLNLLPVPMLDGGHILFYTIELVRGKALSEQVQLAGLKIGMALLFSVMAIAFYNDIARL